MATKPANVELTKDSGKILTAIRNDLGTDFQSRVPGIIKEGDILPSGQPATAADSLASLRAYGTALFNYDPLPNSFLNQLVNVISRVIITSRLFRNPWSAFKQGYLEMGETVEEIFVKLAHSQNYDPELAEKEVYKRVLPDVEAAFHRVNFKKFYKITIQETELREAFLAWSGITDLISKIIESIYSSANFDEFIMMKYLIANAIINGRMGSIQIPAVSAANADAIMIQLKALSDNLQYMSTEYNYAGVPTYSNKDYQYFIFNTEMSANIDVGALARAFNLDKVELMGNVIGVNKFTFTSLEMSRLKELMADNQDITIFTADQLNTLAGVSAVVIDKNWFMIFDNLDTMRQQPNEQGLYWQYFYHVWRVYSTSPFCNAVAITTSESKVTSITLSPTTSTVSPGGQQQFTATVTKTGIATGTVEWSISGQSASGTQITPSGLLLVSKYETSTTITVTAISTENSAISASATVTVGSASGAGTEDTE